MSTYRSLHARSLADPESFWAEAAVRPALGPPLGPRPRHVQPALRPLVRRRRAQHLLQRARPPRRGRPRRPARPDPRQPAHRHASAPSPTPSSGPRRPLRRRDRRRRRRARATASSSTCRWCPRPSSPCSPARASVRSTRSSSAASPHPSSRPASTTPSPKLVIAASCGLEPGRVVAYKPLLDRALDLAAHAARPLPDPPARAGEGRADARPRPRLGRGPGRGRRRSPAPARPPPTRSTSSTPRAPPANPRASSATMAATPRPSSGRCANIYGVRPGETFWAASDVGWVVGHSYIVYAPLLAGCTTIVYEGKPVGTPDAGAFWRVCAEHKVSALFTAPTAFRAIRKEDPDGDHIRRHDLSALRALFLAGERCDPATLLWARDPARHPRHRPLVADRDRLGDLRQPAGPRAAAGQARLAEPAHARLRRPGPGRVRRHPAAGRMGAICLRLPLPPGCLPTLWNADARFRAAYLDRHPGWYLTGDAGYRDEDGYLFVMSRTDDVINVAGHRLSTGAIEEVLAGHPAVAECAVIGVADPLKGELPMGLVVLKAGAHRRPCHPPRRAHRQGPRGDRPRGRPSSSSPSSPACPRPARARSCAAP